jgi:hypothetical protein
VEVELRLHALLVLQEDVFDEHIQKLKLLKLAESFIPEDDTSSSENTDIFEHFIVFILL